MTVEFGELRGKLNELRPVAPAEPATRVVLSNILHGSLVRPGATGVAVRFVGRGAEHYSIGDRYYPLAEDQFMIAPQVLGSEVAIRRSEREGTLGLCIYFPEIADGLDELLAGPIVLPASCDLGRELKQALLRLNSPVRSPEEPDRIAREAKARLAHTILQLDAQIEAVAGLKRRTRFEAVRRMNVARAYLHRVTDRAVPLSELATEAAVSPFQLLRGFRDTFGQTPAAYHRRLRLRLTSEAAERESLPLSCVAHRFGFATVSSFSHAFRRTFGEPPLRRLSAGED